MSAEFGFASDFGEVVYFGIFWVIFEETREATNLDHPRSDLPLTPPPHQVAEVAPSSDDQHRPSSSGLVSQRFFATGSPQGMEANECRNSIAVRQTADCFKPWPLRWPFIRSGSAKEVQGGCTWR